MKGEMATTHLGLVLYGCAVAAILRSHGVSSAPIEGETANVQTSKNGDLEQQLMQQSGENKSSQPSSSSVDHGAAVDRADPRQDAPMTDDASLAGNDADAAADDDVEATGLSSDYYGLQSFDDATQPKRLNDQLREDGIEDVPAAGLEEDEEDEEDEDGDRNSDGQLPDELMSNERNKEGYSINFQERSFEDDAEKIENEEKNNRGFRNEDDIEQMERPLEDVNAFEGQEAPPSGAASENKEIISDDPDSQENGREEESTDLHPSDKNEEGDDGGGERSTRVDRQNQEQQMRYTEDGQRNTAETFDSRLLISREKKTLQGKWLAAELDKSDRQRDEREMRLSSDDDGLTEDDVYM